MPNPLLAPELLELIESGDQTTLQEAVDNVHPAEMADLAAALDGSNIWPLLAMIPQQHAAEIFSQFDLDRQVELARGANRQAMARMQGATAR